MESHVNRYLISITLYMSIKHFLSFQLQNSFQVNIVLIHFIKIWNLNVHKKLITPYFRYFLISKWRNYEKSGITYIFKFFYPKTKLKKKLKKIRKLKIQWNLQLTNFYLTKSLYVTKYFMDPWNFYSKFNVSI